MFQELRQRQKLNSRRMAKRRALIRIAKFSLPVFAVALLSLVALWPEINRLSDRTRMSMRALFAIEAESGRMLEPHYRGVDQRGRPYTLTAAWASQASQSRIDLGNPVGDILLENGTWMQARAKDGVYMQHSELLDLQGNVVLYRGDGTTLRTQTATVDIRQGVGSGNDKTHAEGPFGVLDAQGFTMVDKGAAVQFQGPARLVLNESQK